LPEILEDSTLLAIFQRLKHLEDIRKDTITSHQLAAQVMARKGPKTGKKYQKGDKVWLEAKNLATTHPSAKLAPQRYGPFTVLDTPSPVNVRLKLPNGWNIHPVFHISLITPYIETTTHGPNFERPNPPDFIDNEEAYEVESLLDSRMFHGNLQYLVRWKGYSPADDEWMFREDLEEDMVDAQDTFEEFHRSHPHVISPTSPPALSSNH
ncbi:hypothetical protein EW146_g8459, partial [Bondarzewia mesenterica]